jgi:3',5'-cyclic AMP phosphodiesterase CpdA
MSTSQIRTRILILSDTHGHSLFDPQTKPDEAQRYAFHKPLPSADVAIHCGDLTLCSHVKEYQKTFDVMRSIAAPLKLVIPGNHDCSMDVGFWDKDVRAPIQPDSSTWNRVHSPETSKVLTEKLPA